MIEINEIKKIAQEISGQIVHTPCIRSYFLSEIFEANIYLKLENFQCTGSFKERGALACLLSLSDEQRAAGVVTASAGNHAQAVAYHATRLGIKSTVFMPISTPSLKISRTERFGAEVLLVGRDYDEAFEQASEYAQTKGAFYLHAYDNEQVIAGQASVGLEIIEALPHLDACIVAIGGGGLAAGVATVLKAHNPLIEIIGVEQSKNASMQLAVQVGHPQEVPPAKTIAEGIGVRKVGVLTYAICKLLVDRLYTVTDAQIAESMADLWEMQKILAEGAAAATTAALKLIGPSIKGKTVCAIIGGGNVDNSMLLKIVERRLMQAGRLICLEVRIPSEPSAFSELAQLLAKHSMNIVNLRKQFAYLKDNISQDILQITLIARCGADVAELLSSIGKQGFKVSTVNLEDTVIQ